MSNEETLFEHKDDDGDSVRLGQYGDHLILVARDEEVGSEARVRLFGPGYVDSLDAVRNLHSTLGRWIDEEEAKAETEDNTAPTPALHVDTAVTADDVRRIAADEMVKLLITGSVLDRFKALAQEEVQRHEAERRNQMRHAAQEEIRQYLPDFKVRMREIARLEYAHRDQAAEVRMREVADKAVRNAFTKIAETGV